jgi:DNA processing protein
MDELSAWLTLARAPSLHAGTLASLLQHFPDAASIAGASVESLRAAGLDAKSTHWLRAPPREAIARDLRWLERDTHHFIPWRSALYPPLLSELSDAPVGLFVRGNPALLAQPQLAIVGSRNPTPAGSETAHRFAAQLSRAGLVITSGLAIGIDAACHRGALEAEGPTIAVCGTGLDIPYPRANAALADAIAQTGALVSEFSLGMPALKTNFPRRNRVISGLALGTLVVEAALRSGSLITARLAAEQGREVFAIPGSINNELARGCHQLIQNGAKLVGAAEDIFVELRGLLGGDAARLAQCTAALQLTDGAGNMSSPLDKEYEILLDALGFEPAGVDLLVERTGLRADEVASMLLMLELADRIESYPGGLYVRARPKAVK